MDKRKYEKLMNESLTKLSLYIQKSPNMKINKTLKLSLWW